jgi:hypothetical protein
MRTLSGVRVAPIMKLFALLLTGFGAGVAASWTYIASMRATVKLYKSYIHDRIDVQSKDGRNGQGTAAAPSTHQTVK